MTNPRNEKAYALRYKALQLKKKVSDMSVVLPGLVGTSSYIEKKAQIAKIISQISELEAAAREADRVP